MKKNYNTIPREDRLIVALDFPDIDSTKRMVERLGDSVNFYKIGLELMMGGSYFGLIKWLKQQNKKIFCDLKLHDISATMVNSVKNLTQYDIDLLTIHASNRDTMEKVSLHKGKMMVIAVTVLTNLDQKDLLEIGFNPNFSVEELVIKRTKIALESGLDGVVSSALETKRLRTEFGQDFLIVTPGIRMSDDINASVNNEDQKRVASADKAIKDGSSYLVVGRPITQSNDPKLAAQKFVSLI